MQLKLCFEGFWVLEVTQGGGELQLRLFFGFFGKYVGGLPFWVLCECVGGIAWARVG